MTLTEHTYRAFDDDIAGMRNAVVEMGGLAERQFRRAVEAIATRNPGLAAQVLADERRVNALHVQVDDLCSRIIALRQPIAVDLREIIAVIHSINDLERIGDEAKKIALKAKNFVDRPLPVPFDGVARMAAIAIEMLRASIDAFVRQDEGAADRLESRDAEVDVLRDQLVGQLIQRMADEPAIVSDALALVFVVQSIERVGDHAKNIAEYVVHVVSGVDPRHSRTAAAAS